MPNKNQLSGLEPGSAQYYRARFEGSVLGNHQIMPTDDIRDRMANPEAPPTHPTGPNTNFQYPTPMPFRYDERSLPMHNARHLTGKQEHPIYATTSGEIGKLSMQASDFPMRWYGLEGVFTNQWAAALPKTRVSTGLNTSMDRSKFAHEYDQGWRGNMGLTDFNIANITASSFYNKPTRTPASYPSGQLKPKDIKAM